MAVAMKLFLATCLVAPLVADMPSHGGHHHSSMRLEVQPGDSPRNVLRDADFRRDEEHIQEHLLGRKIDLQTASPEELDFHFFKMHDADNDLNLDGLELHTAIAHAMDHQVAMAKKNIVHDPQRLHDQLNMVRDHIVSTVDRILDEEDHDDDGYITYIEYTSNRRNHNALNSLKRQTLMDQSD